MRTATAEIGRRREGSFAWVLLVLGAVVLPAHPAAAAVEDVVHVDIPSMPLGQALKALADQGNFQIVFAADAVKNFNAPKLAGAMHAEEALKTLLNGTKLAYVRVADTYVIKAEVSPVGGVKSDSTADSGYRADGDAISEESLRLAQTEASAAPTSSLEKSNQEPQKIEEIIVTAQKRRERLQDVPVPVTALKAETLVESGQLRLQDYYTSVPGLTVTPQASLSFQSISVRGVTTGAVGNPTVAVTVDDVPYGASTYLGGGGGVPVPDIDPGDLAQIEVLRGPQGTLYGASSLGGLIKFVTVEPSSEAFSGRVEAGANGVYHGAQLGYNARASVNVPISETWALRASGFTRQDPGYIDNVQTGQHGVNKQQVAGGRLAALWKPSDALTLKLGALFQDYRGDGFNNVDMPVNGYVGPPVGDLQQSYLRGAGDYDRKTQAYSAVLTARFGSVETTAITGFNVNSFHDVIDFSNFVGQLPQTDFGVSGAALPEHNKTDKFTQEIRLSAPLGRQMDWLMGAFYTHENSRYGQRVVAVDPATGMAVGEGFNGGFNPTLAELAAFADLTLHVTDRFDVQLGGRESQIRQTYSELDVGSWVPGLLGLPSPNIIPETYTRAHAFTYLATPRLKVSADLMLYARLASGYRPGGPNLGFGAIPQYHPDKTRTYEVGVKGDLFRQAITLDASAYYIDWSDIQLNLFNPITNTGYISNGSAAKSQGVELAIQLRPMQGLTIDAWVAYDNAVLTQAFPLTSTAVGIAGDRLPYSSRFSSNLSVERQFTLTSHAMGFVGGAESYVSGREGEFASIFALGPGRQTYPAYARTDLRAGVRLDSWTVNFFVNNIADKRAALYGGLGAFPAYTFIYIQPRMVGLSLIKGF